jgi:thymidine kinase
MSLEVVCGPMFSGKSSHIYTIVKRYASVGLETLVIKPTSDIRYSDKPEVVTHDGVKFACLATTGHLMHIDTDVTVKPRVIIIEEAQFFDDLVLFARCMVENFKKNVVVVGLDGDSERKPFGQLLDCIPLADKVTKLTAFCTGCCDGTPAIFTYRKIKQSGQVLIGGHDSYEPYCRACYLDAIRKESEQ